MQGNQFRAATSKRAGRSGTAPTFRASKAGRSALVSDTGNFQAVFLYDHWARPYFVSVKDVDQKYELVVECLPTDPKVKALQTVFLARPQHRYMGRDQCQLMLQSKAVEGQKELLSGLRPVALPPMPGLPALHGVYVGDYKLDRHGKAPVPTMVVLVGKPYQVGSSGWALVLVVDTRYKKGSRPANEQTARTAILNALPHLRGWLAQLPTEATT